MKRINYYFDLLILVLLVFGLILSLGNFLHPQTQDLFSIIINAIALIPVVLSTLRALRTKKITVDLLATFALALSLLNHEYFSSLFINLMLTTARLVDGYTERKTEDSIKSLLKLKPERVKIKTSEGLKIIKVEQLKVGDIIHVDLGERIPIDGVITSGAAAIDQSSLTGESLPIEKKVGDEVLSSTLVTSGNLEIQTTRVGKDTALEKIIQLVSDSQLNKPEITQKSDLFAQWYIIIMLIVTIGLYAFTKNIDLVLSVILVVCADDIAVAIPLAFIGGIRAASRSGIVIKGGKFLEAIGEIKTLVVDKTGTLTTGKLVVSDQFIEKGLDSSEIFRIISGIVQRSTHPISKAIFKYTSQNVKKVPQADDLEEVQGEGLKATIEGKKYLLGKKKFIAKYIKPFDKAAEKFIDDSENKGYNVSIIADEKSILAIIALSDKLKPDTKKVIQSLIEEGIERIIMLTGDNEQVAKTIAEETGIKEFHANLLPEGKIDYLKTLIKKGSKTGMVGDGVNDAAALSLADVGIAMGGIGSDAAIDSSDVIIINDKLAKVKDAIALSKFIMNISKGDYLIWVIVNLIGLFLVFARVLNPSGAAFYNFITDFIPLVNSMRAFFWKNKNITKP